MWVPNRGLARLQEERHAGTVAEIAREQAASLGRAGAKLERALARLAAWDAGEREPGAGPDGRERLRAVASEALWYYVVQREALGARDLETVLREYRVPREVYLRMGVYGVSA